MKLLSSIRLAGLCATLALACGCPGGGSTPVATGGQGQTVSKPPVTQGPADDAALTADGKHFAISRTYRGECMPAGSRGGCYEVTLEADGSFRNMLLDAAIIGTYEINGDQVKLTPSGEAPPSTMTLSADRTKLDDYVYQPRVEP